MAYLPPPTKDYKSWRKLIEQLTDELRAEQGLSIDDARSIYADLWSVYRRGLGENLAARTIRNNMVATLKAIEEEAHPGIRSVQHGRSTNQQIMQEVPRDALAKQIKLWKKGEETEKVSQILAKAGVVLTPEQKAALGGTLHSYEKGNTGKMAVASGLDFPLPKMPDEPMPPIEQMGEGRMADPLYEGEIEGSRGLYRGGRDRREAEVLGRRANRKIQQDLERGWSRAAAMEGLSPRERKAYLRLQAMLEEGSTAEEILFEEERIRRGAYEVDKAPFHEPGLPQVEMPDKRGMREPHNMDEWRREMTEMLHQKQLPKNFEKTDAWRAMWYASSPKKAGAAIANQVNGEELQEALMQRLLGERDLPPREYALERLRAAAATKGGNPKVRELLRAVEGGQADRVRQLKAELKALEAAGDPGISLLLRSLKKPADRATQLLRNVPKWVGKLPL